MRDSDTRADALQFIEGVAIEFLVACVKNHGEMPSDARIAEAVQQAAVLHTQLAEVSRKMGRDYNERLVKAVEGAKK